MKATPERIPCENSMYAGQSGFQKLLVVIAVLCIPIMLFAKPYYIMREQKLKTVCLLEYEMA